MTEELASDDEVEISEKTRQLVLRFARPEELLAGLDPEELLAGLDPEERLAGLDPEERLAGMTSAERRQLLRLLQEEIDESSEDNANRNGEA